jgi:putative transposase
VLASVDFTTIEVWTGSGLVTCYLLFFMELATRQVHFADLTTNPDEAWLLQIARNVTDTEEGFLRGKRYILMDRDTKFSEVFRNTLEDGGAKPVRLPPRSPNLNSHIERFLRSLKKECLEQIFFGEKSLHAATVAYLEHFHAERNHQGMGNRLLIAGSEVGQMSGEIKYRERLGGLLRYYYRLFRSRNSRYSAAMELRASGVDLSTIALWLGHESIETTQIYYAPIPVMCSKRPKILIAGRCALI